MMDWSTVFKIIALVGGCAGSIAIVIMAANYFDDYITRKRY
jgi:hypothetical protein